MEILVPVLSIFGLVLGVLWILLPFILLEKLNRVISRLETTNQLLYAANQQRALISAEPQQSVAPVGTVL